MAIENNIWQTYECLQDELPDYAQFGISTWKHHNPNWKHNYMSGQDRENFFKEEFGGEVYETYMNLPMGVMKAGLWRFGILYIYGGVYADMDTICTTPIENWLYQNYDMILDIEKDTPWLATQTIAAKAGHPLLKIAIDLCVERMKDFKPSNHMVHFYTDVAMFTDSLYRELGVEPYKKHINEWAPELLEMPFLKDNKVHIFHGEDAKRLLKKDVLHLYWGDGSVSSLGGHGVSDDQEKGWIAWKKDPKVNDPDNHTKLANWDE